MVSALMFHRALARILPDAETIDSRSRCSIFST